MANEGEVVEFATEKGDQSFFTEDENRGRKLVLDEMKLTGGENDVLLVSCKVVAFTVESKAGEYQAVRGYAYVEPQDLWVHIPIYDPAKKVGPGGNVGILGDVFRQIATEIDFQVMAVANIRQDRQIVGQDEKQRIKDNRVQGKGVVSTQGPKPL